MEEGRGYEGRGKNGKGKREEWKREEVMREKEKNDMVKMMLKYLLLLPLLLQLGCKPHVSLSGATIPPEAKTITVGFFTNNTTLGAPSLSQRFTEKLRDVVSRQTNLALMRSNGDLQFEGYIQDYQVTPLAITGNDAAAMNRLTIKVNVKYINTFDKAKNFEDDFSAFVDFKSTDNLSAREPELVEEVFRQLTENIFNRAFNNW